MMQRWLAPVLVCLALSACSSSGPPAASGTDISMSLTVPQGSEIFRCELHQMAATPTFVVGGSHRYTVGSHHFLLFRTDLTAIPAGLEGARDCYEQGNDVMPHVRGVIVGGQVPEGHWSLPAGVGLPLAVGEVVLLQAHYINTTLQDLNAQVTVHLDTSSGSGIRDTAGVLFYYDPFIHVPARAMATASMQCTVPKDIRLVTAASHFHKRGVGFAAYLDLAGAPITATPFYTSTDWQHPSDLTATLDIAAGSAIRWACDYDNRQGSNEYYQGPSAENNEMCMFTGIYYPAMDLTAERCMGYFDRFGTGTATCGTTLACLQACPAGSAPMGLGQGGQTMVDPCWQRCFVDSCPTATKPLTQALRCLATSCASACAAGGSGCASCAASACATPFSACWNAVCDAP
jgi:hypothetical protein